MIRFIISVVAAAALSAVAVPSLAASGHGVWHPNCFKTSSMPDDPPVCR